ncbi:MAG TPA: orotidine-5'-phosphate decarboxylase [Candidatus Paceibacterota bacterium]|nr:orotidine-5'-phosphate decarboxylase [Candidatus Paceibacterota bacterium]
MNDSKIILALDGLPPREALRLMRELGPHLYAVKIHDLYDSAGPVIVRMLQLACSHPLVWVDYKLYDIPETMERRAKALVANGAGIISAAAEAGCDGMRAVKESGAIVYAVTVLTSEPPEVTRSRTGKNTNEAVLHRAIQAAAAGVDGVVCSAQEIGMLRSHDFIGRMLKRVAVGVRSRGIAVNDQQRIGTPRQAIADGANHFVIGRELTRADDPIAEFHRVVEDVGLVPA